MKSMTSGSPCSSGFSSLCTVEAASVKKREEREMDGIKNLPLWQATTADRIANMVRNGAKEKARRGRGNLWIPDLEEGNGTGIGSVFGGG